MYVMNEVGEGVRITAPLIVDAIRIEEIPLVVARVLTGEKHVNVDIRAAAFICVGFLFGGLIGGHLATALSNVALQRIFGVALLIIGTRMLVAR